MRRRRKEGKSKRRRQQRKKRKRRVDSNQTVPRTKRGIDWTVEGEKTTKTIFGRAINKLE